MRLFDLCVAKKLSGGGGGSADQLGSFLDGSVSGTIKSGVSEIKAYKFWGCSNLERVELPNVTILPTYVFGFCEKLSSVYLPEVVTLNDHAFYSVGNEGDFTELILPKAETLRNGSVNIANLERVELPNATSIDYRTFQGSNSLTTVILGKRANVIGGAPTYPESAIYYVNDNDYDWYQTASGWSYIKTRIKRISELPA